MMPHCKRDAQFEIFPDLCPVDTEATPKLALPIQRSAEIDIARVANIFGITVASARNMAEDHLFPGSYKVSSLTPWRINYDAVVAYCNNLRLQYRISSRLPPLGKGRRHRDEDLLPFPLAETISGREVSEALECSRDTVSHLLDSGGLIGYRVRAQDVRGNPWRIWRLSLERYIASLHASAAANSASSHR
jgi:hypothetical protein